MSGSTRLLTAIVSFEIWPKNKWLGFGWFWVTRFLTSYLQYLQQLFTNRNIQNGSSQFYERSTGWSSGWSVICLALNTFDNATRLARMKSEPILKLLQKVWHCSGNLNFDLKRHRELICRWSGINQSAHQSRIFPLNNQLGQAFCRSRPWAFE